MAQEKEHGARFLFGYEEALGYTIGDMVRDKDGISTALLVCEMVAWLTAQGKSIDDYQLELAKKIGVFTSAQKSLTLAGQAQRETIARAMARLRDKPPQA